MSWSLNLEISISEFLGELFFKLQILQPTSRDSWSVMSRKGPKNLTFLKIYPDDFDDQSASRITKLTEAKQIQRNAIT